MAEKAAIFGGMALGKGIRSFRGVTLSTEFFRLFFPHFLESAMILVFRQFGRSFFWGVEQEKENGGTEEDKGNIQEEKLDSFVRCSDHDFRSGC